MSGMVLRCPNCGTTRATPGLFEACHEADVRHYCTNHAQGLWRDTPACVQCGARLGEPDRAPIPAPLPPRTPVRPSVCASAHVGAAPALSARRASRCGCAAKPARSRACRQR